jgi:hypothetical protein
MLYDKESNTTKTSGNILWGSLQDWPIKLRIINQTEEEVLEDREDDGSVVFEMEQANKSLP